MYRLLVVTDTKVDHEPILWAVDAEDLTYSMCAEARLYDGRNGHGTIKPDGVLLDVEHLTEEQLDRAVTFCQDSHLPALAVVSPEGLGRFDPNPSMDDFIVQPFQPRELVRRLDQAMLRSRGPQSQEVVKSADLLIDLDKYEVTLGGRRVLLTYKEYQLLVLLAKNPGRVYTRDNLLREVWGYDYFGGTRTVDVHIRRLRSKIEGVGHSFIETIWNVGYRFKINS